MTCFLMYLRKALLDQRPISMIIIRGIPPGTLSWLRQI
jgi:hypothetical protein